MSDLGIRQDFIDGLQEIYTTLFNDGITEGINLYILSEENTTNIYGESKYKKYKQPIRLLSKASLSPTQGQQDTECVKNTASFTVPYGTLLEKEIDVSKEGLDKLQRSVIEFRGVYYLVDVVNPKAYVEDCFLTYSFQCTEDTQISELLLEEIEIEYGEESEIEENG